MTGITALKSNSQAPPKAEISASILRSWREKAYYSGIKDNVNHILDERMSRFFFRLDRQQGELMKVAIAQSIDGGDYDHVILPNENTRKLAKKIIWMHENGIFPIIPSWIGMKN
jgi:hypothetical protein